MTVDINMVVSLKYKLTNQQTGETIEETVADRPMQFLYGIERIIPTFEENIHGLKAGDSFDFGIVSSDAYGDRNETQIAHIPVSVFEVEDGKMNEQEVYVGALLPMTDSEGNHLRGKVMDITADTVVMDFNHPLAGTDLHFVGEILEVRAATEEEINHGHSHGAHGHHH